MKKQIFVYKHGRPSTKKIYDELNIPELQLIFKSVKDDSIIIREKNKLKEKKFEVLNSENSVVIRWGSRVPIIRNENTIVYNKIDNIELVNQKGKCRRFLDENNIPIPKTWLNSDESLLNLINENSVPYPLIGRPEHHGRGSNFFVINNDEEMKIALSNNCSYFSLIYPKTREFGVHVGHGKILAIMEKPKPKDDKIAWNRALNDEPFTVVPMNEHIEEVCRLALNATKACGLDFCRVDIMFQTHDSTLPTAVVCELNTAPTLNSSPYVMSRWIKYFSWLFSFEERVKHWDHNLFKKVHSLSWKNFQLDSKLKPHEDY